MFTYGYDNDVERCRRRFNSPYVLCYLVLCQLRFMLKSLKIHNDEEKHEHTEHVYLFYVDAFTLLSPIE